MEHAPVMLEQLVNAVVGDRHGSYVDATFGRGGHARRLLAELSSRGRLLVIDRDADAIASAADLARRDSRVQVCRGRFGSLATHLTKWRLGTPAGVMFDVGVSSPQVDDAERGFSFQADGPLDMRMDRRDSLTAATWLNDAPEGEIADVIHRYGDERHARQVARRLVAARPLATTAQLAAAVTRAIPAPQAGRHAATRVFQAVRIHINDELGELDRGLDAAFAALKAGGRLATITFHGLEHRLVRRRFRQWLQGPALPRRLPAPSPPPLARRVAAVGRGVRPTSTEIRANPRARSAFLQAVEKLQAVGKVAPAGGAA